MMPLVRNGKIVVKNNTLAIPPEDMQLCAGTNCAGGTEPSIQMTITADDADLPIAWCGKTWEKAATSVDGVTTAHSGEPLCVCPLLWQDIGYSSASYFGQRWAYSTGLSLQRGNSFQGGPRHEIRLWTPSNTYYDNGLSAGPPRFFNFGNTIGVLTTGSPWVVANVDSDINDYFFGANQAATSGSYSNANGVVFEWAKGDNWPS